MGRSRLAEVSSCCSVLAEAETKQKQIKAKVRKLATFLFKVVQHGKTLKIENAS